MLNKILTSLILLLFIQFAYAEQPIHYVMPAKANDLSKPILIKFEKLDNYAVIKLMINGKGPFHFMIDTGSAATVLSSKLVQDLNLPKLMQRDVTINGEPRHIDFYRISNMKIEEAEMFDYDVLVLPEPSIITKLNQSKGVPIDGVLGFGAFYHFLLQLNFSASSLGLASGALDESDKNTIHFDDKNGLPAISITFKDKTNPDLKINCIIDSGFNDEFILPSSIKKFPFRPLLEKNTSMVNVLLEQKVTDIKIDGTAIIGNITIDKPIITSMKRNNSAQETNGLIGVQALKYIDITFDQKNKLVKIDAIQ